MELFSKGRIANVFEVLSAAPAYSQLRPEIANNAIKRINPDVLMRLAPLFCYPVLLTFKVDSLSCLSFFLRNILIRTLLYNDKNFIKNVFSMSNTING